ncbi:MAG: TRAP transporter large permease subunit [Cyanobacteria bacterium NC_groundwater_1444_Ag_S-0.65um_54_12]|nr:TRAP transporter large permease subunit [Cyanobacteria bacterium NC_groundwater_1444_Ag_S-0.65um_54_12]
MTAAVSVGLGLLTLLGAPLFIIIAAITLIGFVMNGQSATIFYTEMYKIAEQPMFIAIPLFTFAGYLMAEAKTSTRLINLTRALVGWLPGGIAVVALLSCAFFTVFTGVSGVTIIALGGLLLPALIKEGYPERFTLGLLTTGGSRGMLFPPSLPIIIYGVIAQVDINKLFLAGIIPGALDLLVALLLCIILGFRCKVARTPFNLPGAWQALREAAWEIPVPFIIFGGIYGGVLTAAEAAVAVALYVFIVEVFVYRDLHLVRDIPRVVRDSMILVGGIFIIIGAALGLTNLLVDQEVPDRLFQIISPYIKSPLSFLIVLNIFLLVVAALLDVFSAILVVLPLILPIAAQYNINPLHLGVVFLINLEIGYSLPPMGLNLFVAAFRFDRSILSLYRSTIPFLLATLLVLILITYIPQLSLGLLGALHIPTASSGILP